MPLLMEYLNDINVTYKYILISKSTTITKVTNSTKFTNDTTNLQLVLQLHTKSTTATKVT